MSGRYLLEGCADSLKSAVNIDLGGADRIELCANLIIGGTTPSATLLKQVKARVKIPVRVLIRPRFGDFLYTESEVCEMEESIQTLRKAGADGVVIGALTPEGSLDMKIMRRLILAADGSPVTLHRAFDMTADPMRALEEAVSLGVDTILTSAHQDSARDGITTYKRLLAQAHGRIQIMAGGGINADVISALIKETSLTAFHMSGKSKMYSGMQYRNTEVHMGLPGISEYEMFMSDEKAFQAAAAVLDANG